MEERVQGGQEAKKGKEKEIGVSIYLIHIHQ